jgi:UDP-N-acetylglucosamine 2-epimerase (non-hydrolysing)
MSAKTNTVKVKKRVLVFAGTRPEIIKMASVCRALSASTTLEPFFCYTGQHRELAKPFLDFFELVPQAELDLMRPGQSLGQLTARASEQMDRLFHACAGDGGFAATMVQGDTTTAFAGALASFYHKVPVGHVEAGLRTSTITEPFPEELNRRLITRVANFHFAPTATASEHLRKENVQADDILETGNTGIDALLWTRTKVREPQSDGLKRVIGTEGVVPKPLVLVTAHRRENIGAPLERITSAIKKVASQYRSHQFILPVHKNPAVEKIIYSTLGTEANIHLLPPLDYQDLVWVMNQCVLILSDSGGIQEEAPSLNKPVLVLRNETERPEAVDYGTSILVGSDIDSIFKTASAFLSGSRKLNLPNQCVSPYGDGHAAERIVSFLEKRL